MSQSISQSMIQDKGLEVRYLAAVDHELNSERDVQDFCDDRGCELLFVVDNGKLTTYSSMPDIQAVINSVWPRIAQFYGSAPSYCLVFGVAGITKALEVLTNLNDLVGGDEPFINRFSLYPNAAGQLDLACADAQQ